MKGLKIDQSQESAPTRSEMDVLKILWENGPATVRFVHDKLNEQKKSVIYTSTLKLMQIMKDKGILERDERQMKHVYSAVEESKIKGGMLHRFVENTYDGSATRLMMALLGSSKPSAEEIQEMKDILNTYDNSKQQ